MTKTFTRRDMLKSTAAGALVSAPFIGNAQAQAGTTWKVQSVWDAGTTGYRLFEEWCNGFKEKSGGELSIQPFPAKAVAADNNSLFDAVRSGVLQGMNPFTLYWAGKIPSTVFLSSYPMGPDQPAQWDTLYYGLGMLEMAREIYAKQGLYFVGPIHHDANIIHSKVPIRSVDDLKGKKIRLPGGMVAEVFQTFGCSTVALPGSDIFPALEKGTIDAADYVGPAVNYDLGFHQVTKYILFGPPGTMSVYQPVGPDGPHREHGCVASPEPEDAATGRGPGAQLLGEAFRRDPEGEHGGDDQVPRGGLRGVAHGAGRHCQVPQGGDSDLVQLGEEGSGRCARVQTAARVHEERPDGLCDRRGSQGPLGLILSGTGSARGGRPASFAEREKMYELKGFGFVMPHWAYWGWLAVMPLLLIAAARAKGVLPVVKHEEGASAFERAVDWLSDRTGMFVALWSVNAVLAYTYEVVMRYLFNQPTIWVHESSYLLFGMQYVIAGAYGLLHGSHVRVDVIYTKLSKRARSAVDVITSVFFFAFVLVMISTGWRFFADSYNMGERSLETWQVQYWPVKATLLLGAVLILLAGISQLIKDIRRFERACLEHR